MTKVTYFGFWHGNLKHPHTLKWFFDVYERLKNKIETKIVVHNKYLSNPYINRLLLNLPVDSYSAFLAKLYSSSDMIHVITQWSNYWRVSKYSKSRIKILTFHDPFDPEGNLMKGIHDEVINFDLIITPSKYTKRILVELAGGSLRQNIRVIYNPVNRKVFYKLPLDTKVKLRSEFCKKYFSDTPDIMLLYVGTDKPSKNIERLLFAISYLQENLEGSPFISLIKVGSNSRKDKISTLANKLGVNILFLENIEDRMLNILYNISDVYVHPSLREGFGMPIVEAMATGTPIVASGVTSIPEVLGNAGVLVNPLDAWDIANSIERIISSASLANTLAKRALKRSILFDINSVVKAYMNIYTNLNESL